MVTVASDQESVGYILMKEIIVSTQKEFDALPARFEEYTKIIIKNTTIRLVVNLARENSSVEARENSSVVARGNSSVVAWENSSVVARENSSVVARENSSVVARENSSVVARENSSVVARENSSVVAWGNSSVVAWGNSSVVARGNSSVVARGNSSVVAWENSSVEAWGNSSVEARENSSVEARENVVVRVFSAYLKKVILYGFAVAIVSATITVNIEKKSEYCHIQITKDLGWFERNAVEKNPVITLYKRVSKDFKTQENKKNETLWLVGSTVNHPAWKPDNGECGEGKFHACSRPYFCDEFRNENGDRYIAVSIKLEDLYEWKNNPHYPHKIGFRACEVLYECDKFGKKIGD